MPKIKCNDGADLFYNVTGQGKPLILIAGGFCDHHVWDDVIGLLNSHFQVITYDNRGIGQSGLSEGNYTIELLADDLKCLLNQLKISSAHIVGHSMGGFIAQYFAANNSEKVLSLSLLSSLLAMNQLGHDYLDMMVDGLKNKPDELRQSLPEIAGRIQATESILQQIALCKNHDARSYIKRIDAPTLIASGLKEPVVTKVESQRLVSAIKNVKQTILLDCGHMLQRESPIALAKGLLNFLNTNF
jgi:pimeloyl-ACP methyl ester carboxylesterase